MDSIKETIKKNRPNISASSVKTYCSIVSNLYKYMKKTQDLDGCVEYLTKHPKEVLEYLKDKDGSKRKTQLASLVVLTEKHPHTVELYRKQMLDDAHKYNDREKDQEKTETQKENWITQEELKTIYADLDKDNRPLLSKTSLKPNEFQRLQNFIILSLYVLQPPRRLQDYTEMRLKGEDKEKDNYINKTKFVFNKYKTAKAHGKEEVPINPKLKFILDKWKKLNPHDWLLVGITDNKFSSSQLQQRLNSILGKKASVNILRHSFLSDKYKDIDIREMEETATAMGHTKEQAMLYAKK
jgi:integrase